MSEFDYKTYELLKKLDDLDEHHPEYSEQAIQVLLERSKKNDDERSIYVEEYSKRTISKQSFIYKALGKIVFIYLVIAIVIYVIFYLSMK